MATYKSKINPFTGQLQHVVDETTIEASDILTDSTGESVQDKIDTLESAGTHTQGTDQTLDLGGVSEVSAAEVKDAVDKAHASGSDDQDLSSLVPKTYEINGNALSGNIDLVASDIDTDATGTTIQDDLDTLNAASHTQNTDTVIAPTATPGSDHTATGVKTTLTAGANLVFSDVCYMGSDGKMEKGDAGAIATANCIALCLATIAENATGSFLLLGFAQDASWSWATTGALIYLADIASGEGNITQTAPTDTDDVTQVLGIATSATTIYFKPELVQVEHA